MHRESQRKDRGREIYLRKWLTWLWSDYKSEILKIGFNLKILLRGNVTKLNQFKRAADWTLR